MGGTEPLMGVEDARAQEQNEASLLERLIWTSQQRFALGDAHVEVVTPFVLLSTEFGDQGAIGKFRDPESNIRQWPFGFRWTANIDGVDEEYYELDQSCHLTRVPQRERGRVYLPLCDTETPIPLTGFDQERQFFEAYSCLTLDSRLDALPLMILWKTQKGYTFHFIAETLDGLTTVQRPLHKDEWFSLHRFLASLENSDTALPATSEIVKPRTSVHITVPRRAGPAVEHGIDWNNPPSIVEYLNQYVIGQEAAKRTAAVAISNYHAFMNEPDPLRRPSIAKDATLFVGPTGVGKTLIWETLAPLLGVPLEICPCSNMSASGYVGRKVTEPLQQILDKTNNPSSFGIVFYDEVDKLGDTQIGSTRGYGPLIMNELVSFVDGGTVQLGENSIDTRNLLFVFAGAFQTGTPSLYEIIRTRGQSKRIGFGDVSESPSTGGLSGIQDEDLLKYQFTPELVGRISGRAMLDQLTRDDLRHILLHARNNPLAKYSTLMERRGYTVLIDPTAIDEIVDVTPLSTGARALRQVCQRVFEPLLYDPSQYLHGDTIHLSGVLVRELLNPLNA